MTSHTGEGATGGFSRWMPPGPAKSPAVEAYAGLEPASAGEHAVPPSETTTAPRTVAGRGSSRGVWWRRPVVVPVGFSWGITVRGQIALGWATTCEGKPVSGWVLAPIVGADLAGSALGLARALVEEAWGSAERAGWVWSRFAPVVGRWPVPGRAVALYPGTQVRAALAGGPAEKGTLSREAVRERADAAARLLHRAVPVAVLARIPVRLILPAHLLPQVAEHGVGGWEVVGVDGCWRRHRGRKPYGGWALVTGGGLVAYGEDPTRVPTPLGVELVAIERALALHSEGSRVVVVSDRPQAAMVVRQVARGRGVDEVLDHDQGRGGGGLDASIGWVLEDLQGHVARLGGVRVRTPGQLRERHRGGPRLRVLARWIARAYTHRPAHAGREEIQDLVWRIAHALGEAEAKAIWEVLRASGSQEPEPEPVGEVLAPTGLGSGRSGSAPASEAGVTGIVGDVWSDPLNHDQDRQMG